MTLDELRADCIAKADGIYVRVGHENVALADLSPDDREAWILRWWRLLERGEQALPGPYGLFDTSDGKSWVGGDNGAITYDDLATAMISARILDEMLGVKPGTWQARPFTGADRQTEELHPKMSPLDALRKLERGDGENGEADDS